MRAAAPCAAGYEPRFDALNKTYRYLFHLGTTRDPLLHTRAWHLGEGTGCAASPRSARWRLAIDLGRDAQRVRRVDRHARLSRLSRLRGRQRENTQRTLPRLSLQPEHRPARALLALRGAGRSFMMNMVRILAGTLVEVGRGRLTLDDVWSRSSTAPATRQTTRADRAARTAHAGRSR